MSARAKKAADLSAAFVFPNLKLYAYCAPVAVVFASSVTTPVSVRTFA